MSVSYCGQDAVNLNSRDLGHLQFIFKVLKMGEIKQPRVIIMLLCEKLGKLHGVTRFVLNFGGHGDNRTCKIGARWFDSTEISHAVYENWTKENGYFYCGTLRVKQYPCYYCYWDLIFSVSTSFIVSWDQSASRIILGPPGTLAVALSVTM